MTMFPNQSTPTRRRARQVILGGVLLAATLFGLSYSVFVYAQETPQPVVRVASHPSLGTILTGPDGMTLYTFAKDESGSLGCNRRLRHELAAAPRRG